MKEKPPEYISVIERVSAVVPKMELPPAYEGKDFMFQIEPTAREIKDTLIRQKPLGEPTTVNDLIPLSEIFPGMAASLFRVLRISCCVMAESANEASIQAESDGDKEEQARAEACRDGQFWKAVLFGVLQHVAENPECLEVIKKRLKAKIEEKTAKQEDENP